MGSNHTYLPCTQYVTLSGLGLCELTYFAIIISPHSGLLKFDTS
jgi:hypothetical protein